MTIRKKMSLLTGCVIAAGYLCVGGISLQAAERGCESKRIEQLEQMVKQLMTEVQILKNQQQEKPVAQAVVVKEQGKSGKTKNVILSAAEVAELKKLAAKSEGGSFDKIFDGDSWMNKMTLGGYGDLHANFGENGDKDKFDLHRLVLYAGYDFNDWLKFTSEVEVEHGYVNDGDGELAIEQAYADIFVSDAVNFRVGRMLAPLGIINEKHEPTTFNGVERPAFSKYIVPSTWSVDGAGMFGNLSDDVSYKAYVVGSLDGTGFSDKNGIRGGRMKSRPGLHSPGFTGRVDWQVMRGDDQSLRIGLSGFAGGVNNSDGGGENGLHGEAVILSADYEYSIGDFDLRGAIGHTTIDNAFEIGNGTASEIFGWYQEVGCHFMPENWKTGKLSDSDAVVFVRYDSIDTQYKMPSGVVANGAGERDEWTVGINWWLSKQFVLKLDYQLRNDKDGSDLNDSFNLGVGFAF